MQAMRNGGLAPRIADYVASRGQHAACTLTPQAIERLESYLSEHFAGKEIAALETGCGASTILFAQYATAHRCYCLDDRDQANGSVPFATNFPTFSGSNVEFVFGPTQRTIFSSPPMRPVDVVLIDGPHAYPFPDLEYFAFYPWLKPGGLLVVDDIQLPTINNMFQFLCQDDSFRLLEVAGATAFFERTQAPTFSQEGDGWWSQRFNVQRFPASNPAVEPPMSVGMPFRFSFERPIGVLPQTFTRGFVLLDGVPTTEGDWSTITFSFGAVFDESLVLSLNARPVRPSERPDPALQIAMEQQTMPLVRFSDEKPLALSYAIPRAPRTGITIRLHNYGLTPARAFKDWKGLPPYAPEADVRLLGVSIESLAVYPAGERTIAQQVGSAVRENQGDGASAAVRGR
jgi:predicted O-methyltransferase YrrM